MTLQLLVDQAWKKPAIIDPVWVQFADKLNTIKKRFPLSDRNFTIGLDSFCEAIKIGHARSTTLPNGYGYKNKWIINTFNNIFDPLLSKEFSNPLSNADCIDEFSRKPSSIWNELIYAFADTDKQIYVQKNLLKRHLNISNLQSFVNAFEKAYLQLDVIRTKHEIQKTKEEQTEINRCCQTLGMISNVLYILHRQFPAEEINWCESCFRRAPANKLYCPLHSPYITGLLTRI